MFCVSDSLTGQHSLAIAFWEKSNMPLRAALMASQLCRRLSRHGSLRADSEALLAQSLSYEDLAVELLDAVRDSKLAVQLLCHIQWEFHCEGEDGDGESKVKRVLLWPTSPLESAALDDGLLSVPCKRVLAHRHSQHLLDMVFCGNYPGSNAIISSHSSVLAIFLQSLLPFLPGSLVEVSPCHQPTNEPLSGPSVTRDYDVRAKKAASEYDEEMRDLTAIFSEHKGKLEQLRLRRKRTFAVRQKTNALRQTWQTMADNEGDGFVKDLMFDLISLRFAYFYSVPKVKFTTGMVAENEPEALCRSSACQLYVSDFAGQGL